MKEVVGAETRKTLPESGTEPEPEHEHEEQLPLPSTPATDADEPDTDVDDEVRKRELPPGGAPEQKDSEHSSAETAPSDDGAESKSSSLLSMTAMSLLNADVGSWFGISSSNEHDSGAESSDEESSDDEEDDDDESEDDEEDGSGSGGEVESSRGLDKAFGSLGIPGWLLPATRLTAYEFGLGSMRLAKVTVLMPWYMLKTLLTFIAGAAFPGGMNSKLKMKRRRELARTRKAREIIRKMKEKHGEEVLRERRAHNTSLWTYLKRDVNDVLFDDLNETNEALELLDLGLGVDIEAQ